MHKDGTAFFSRCPRELCAAPTLLVTEFGLKYHLSLKSIPYRDAVILEKYHQVIINVWTGPTRMWAVAWFRSLGRPIKGRLYMRHICGARN